MVAVGGNVGYTHGCVVAVIVMVCACVAGVGGCVDAGVGVDGDVGGVVGYVGMSVVDVVVTDGDVVDVGVGIVVGCSIGIVVGGVVVVSVTVVCWCCRCRALCYCYWVWCRWCRW